MSVEPGRVAIVTGSTSGIGAEIARTGGEAVFLAHDLEEAGTPGRLVEETVSAFGGWTYW